MGIECEREGYRYRKRLREVGREKWGERGGETYGYRVCEREGYRYREELR